MAFQWYDAQDEGNRQIASLVKESIQLLHRKERLRHDEVGARVERTTEPLQLFLQRPRTSWADRASDQELGRAPNRRASVVDSLIHSLEDANESNGINIPHGGDW